MYFGRHRVNTGGVKTSRFVAGAVAVTILAICLAVRLNPSSLDSTFPRHQEQKPLLLHLEASLDGRIKFKAAIAIRRKSFGPADWSEGMGICPSGARPEASYWIPEGDSRILSLLLAQEERGIYGKEEWGVHGGDVVLDVGAYIGTWTKHALARGAKVVIAIEPSPQSVECLKRNLAREVEAGKVVIYPKGIWDSEGALTLFGDSKTGGRQQLCGAKPVRPND